MTSLTCWADLSEHNIRKPPITFSLVHTLSIPRYTWWLHLLSPTFAHTSILFQVLIYNGQLDIIVAASLTERSLMAMKWKGSQKYKQAERKVWKILKSDNEVAGYVRQVDDFSQVWRHFGACRFWGGGGWWG